MPVPSRRLKDLIEGTVDHHASQRWPALEEVTIRWRGSYGYLTGYLSDDDDDTIPLCRIQYLGDPDEWAFAIWQASTDSYAQAILLDGQPTGHPTTALDTACTLYLASTATPKTQPHQPLKDLRGAALAEGKTHKEALRCLKRRISDALYARLLADARQAAGNAAAGPGGQPGNDPDSSAAGSHPGNRLFGQATPEPSPTLRPATPARRNMPPKPPAAKKTRRSP
jgi:hypothetical protein